MGWSSWYAFRTSITESLIMQQASLLVSSGLAAAGYDCVNLDDGWMASSRDANGDLQPDPVKFPDGLATLASALHGMGLKFGVYTGIGARTCQGLPGSYGNYARDAATFARWGVDFVKVDSCGGYPSWTTQATLTEDYRIFGDCLRYSNSNVIYSQELPIYVLGQAGYLQAVQDSSTFANMWRVAADEYPLNQPYSIVQGHLAADLHLHGFAGPGHWNDLDMVLPGYPGNGWAIQDVQNQLAVWAMEASPLIISADLSTVDAAAMAALANPGMVAIDQSGAQCAYSVQVGNIQALVKPHPSGGQAVAFVNMGGGPASATFTLAQLGISTAQATATDVWTGHTTGAFSAAAIDLALNQVRLMQIVPVS